MLEMDRGSRFICRFSIKKLIEIIRKNRIEHAVDYAEATKEYKKKLIDVLQKKLKAAQEGQKVNHHINLAVPCEFTKEYDKAIGMLEMTSNNDIELDQTLYSQLVLDEWNWKAAFETSNSAYLSKYRNHNENEETGI